MNFLDFFKSIVSLWGNAGVIVIAFVVFLIGLGVYKFVKDWLPW